VLLLSGAPAAGPPELLKKPFRTMLSTIVTAR
jgi:hypothetical protein